MYLLLYTFIYKCLAEKVGQQNIKRVSIVKNHVDFLKNNTVNMEEEKLKEETEDHKKYILSHSII